MNKETIKLATRDELPEVTDSIERYLAITEDSDAHLVGRRLISELEMIDGHPEMFIFIARDSKGYISGISNGSFDDKYGITYHTLSIRGQGVGRRLLRTKLNYMLQKRVLIFGKPESQRGLDFAIECGFVRGTVMADRLFWEGDGYVLWKHDYIEP